MTRGENPTPSPLLSAGTPALIYRKRTLLFTFGTRLWALAECVTGLCHLEVKTLLVTILVSVLDAPFRGVGRLLLPRPPPTAKGGLLRGDALTLRSGIP